MIYMLLLFIFTQVACAPMSHVGSAIFYNKLNKNECWSEDDLATLRARRIFELAMPPSVNPEKMNGRYLKEMQKYFRQALRNVGKETNSHCAILLKAALADTIGAHLTKEILPTARFSYYAGYVPYRDVRELHKFLEQIKLLLNTQGLGWARPDRIPQWSNLTVVKVFVRHGKLLNPCSGLVMKRDVNSCIHIPVPKLDDKDEPSAIALPFKSGGMVSLSSPRSENILLKYYTTATRCILHHSPITCRHVDFLNFNNDMWHWMQNDVAPHLADEKLYSAFGGVLRIAAAVQSYGKGLSRRNLYENEERVVSRWHPWKGLSETYVYMDPDWTPKLYVILVVLAAAVICLSQICYTFLLGKSNGCHCTDRQQKYQNIMAFTKDELVNPAILPSQHSSLFYSQHARLRRLPAKTKISSRNSIRTEKVYDLHDNTETMAVIMSDNEDTSEEDSLPVINQEGSGENVGAIRSKSPPKIETSISEVKIVKRTRPKRGQMYSTSTNSHSELTYCREHQDTGSPWSGSSTSEQSITSDSSKSHGRKSRNSRDLAWARRVASKASQAKSTTSGTELDVNSFTTPPSKH
ncbi:PREDICTED: uncharacterized protein LOC106114696 [Papilio xuthus]|uniref:Uncharacterized protein LOC106114696 n=1 Tax=Papilio xuthus TaxID=66420 RepID=A0AAJ6Z226_PAPXU|nr:PREDICTED: uncharacterized protein LOC106114696 [Papilio xuthus]